VLVWRFELSNEDFDIGARVVCLWKTDGRFVCVCVDGEEDVIEGGMMAVDIENESHSECRRETSYRKREGSDSTPFMQQTCKDP